MGYADAMLETVVTGTRKDEVVDAELLEVAQSLNRGGVDAGKDGAGYLEVTVNGVVDDCVGMALLVCVGMNAGPEKAKRDKMPLPFTRWDGGACEETSCEEMKRSSSSSKAYCILVQG